MHSLRAVLRGLVFSFAVTSCLALCAAARAGEERVAFRYILAADAADALSKQLGKDASSAIVSVDSEANAILLRADDPNVAKARKILTELDRRPTQVVLSVKVSSKTPATATAPAQATVIARPTIYGPPGKTMTVSFEKDGETFEIEINPTILEP